MEIKEIIIKTGERIIKITDKVIAIEDLEGFPILHIMPDKLKVKKGMKILRI